ncbi:MAG TPA: DUF2142 domain-containing protein [Tepidisphaeraceae bacterium]|nr:DUF2142 domain-containing protein [Tepidisphaeraceae bacterium]
MPNSTFSDAPLNNTVARSEDHRSRGRRATWVVGYLCLLAAIRVFVFSAAFPFFNNVDEQFHFDLICKYSHGNIPKNPALFDVESAKLFALYSSAEFLHGSNEFPGSRIPPPIYTLSETVRKSPYDDAFAFWSRAHNRNATEFPLYFAIAGIWYDIGKFFGIGELDLLYWVRLINIPLYVALVWFSFLLAKTIQPDSELVYLGVPLLLVAFPQDVYYSLTNDVCSAPLGAMCLYLLIKFHQTEPPRLSHAIGAGLSVAALLLTKLNNAPIYAIVAIVAAARLWKLRSRKVNRGYVEILLLLIAAILPAGLWMIRNRLFVGDFTATAEKTATLGWTSKPFSEYWNHPIFTPSGFATFWYEAISSFWRGEICWAGARLSAGWIDAIYVATSTLFLLSLIVASAISSKRRSWTNPQAMGVSAFLFVLCLTMLIYLSISFDFGDCPYPSRQSPFFTSGRLMLVGLAPFMIMYVSGLEALLGWLKLRSVGWLILVAIAAVTMLSEIAMSMNVFASQYNWFHIIRL